jgi:hypothetical protein
MGWKKPYFLLMSSVPPVVDHVKRTIIQDIKSKSIFNLFNIAAVLAILVIGYFLYKKFNEKFKKGAIRMPSSEFVKTTAAPVKVEEEEIPDAPPVKEE